MDIATVGGLIAAFVVIILGIFFARAPLMLYFDLPSVFITVLGSLMALLISYPLERTTRIWSTMKNAFFVKAMNPGEIIPTLVSFAEKARREGLLSLEEDVSRLEDIFLQKGIQLVVDGTDPELVRGILDTEIAFLESRHKEGERFFRDWATLAPAFGLAGTLIGLIAMLKALATLTNPAEIGPLMAVALITTLYGVLIANVVATPIANKLLARSEREILVKQIMVEGILAIQAGDNPRIVEEKLVAFLAQSDRASLRRERT
ncbi:MAG: motility protein A [bacterium]